MAYNRLVESEFTNIAKYHFVTMFEMYLPKPFAMIDFYFQSKQDFGRIFASNEIEYHKKHGLPLIPSWYKEGQHVAIYIFRYLEHSRPRDWRKFIESIGCVCGGDFGLALLWITGKDRIPKWDSIFSPYENEKVERKACRVYIRYGGPHHFDWNFVYDEEPSHPQYQIKADNYFICFQLI
jgi:hypothetical protein